MGANDAGRFYFCELCENEEESMLEMKLHVEDKHDVTFPTAGRDFVFKSCVEQDRDEPGCVEIVEG